MYSDVFCKVYNEFGWNYYPEVFGQQLLKWLEREKIRVSTSLDLACGTGVLCRILSESGIKARGVDLSSGMIDIARRDNPDIPFDVGDMTVYCPEGEFDLVTCTGDAVTHLEKHSDIEKIFKNVYGYMRKGGYFVFDILNEGEVSESDPFEMDFTDTTRVWFQMTRPGEKSVNLKIRVYENGKLSLEENIKETIHDPGEICNLLKKCGFEWVKCEDHLSGSENCHGTTWFVTAQK